MALPAVSTRPTTLVSARSPATRTRRYVRPPKTWRADVLRWLRFPYVVALGSGFRGWRDGCLLLGAGARCLELHRDRWVGTSGAVVGMLSLVCGVALGVVDGLVLSGVVGPGWPSTSKVVIAYLVIGIVGLAILARTDDAVDDESVGMWAWPATGAIGTVILFTAGVWSVSGGHSQGGSVANVVQSAVAASPAVAPSQAMGSASSENALLMWTAIGAIGSLLGGTAAWVAVIRRK